MREIQKVDEGDYRVEVTNGAGTVSSEIGAVKVLDPLAIALRVVGGSGDPGGTLALEASTTGAVQDPTEFQFFKQSRTTGRWNFVATQSSGTLLLNNLQQGDEALYKVRAFGKVNGLVESAPVQVFVNDPVAFASSTGVTSLTLAEGDNSELRVNVLGFNPQIQWYRMAVGASDWVAVVGGTSSVLPLVGVVSQQAGSYGVVVHNAFSWAPVNRTPRVVARVAVNAAPVVTLSSGSQVALLSGTALVLQAQVRDTTALGRISYVWRRNGKTLPNGSGTAYYSSWQQTTPVEYRLDSVGSADAGLYDVLVSNNYGAALSDSARVTVNLKPTVVLQTKAIITSVGGVATFRVEASGSGDLSYQWWKRPTSGGIGERLLGETQKVLQVSGVNLSDSGTAYWVVVTSDNGFGTATSAEGVLTVANEGSVRIGSGPSLVGAPSTTLRSGSLDLRIDATATETSGAGSVSTRWRKNGVVVQTQEVTRGADGTFACSYALPCTSNDSDGVYDVVVDNGVCFVTSAGLRLTVDPKIESFTVPALAKQGDGIKAIVSVSGTSAGAYAFQWFKDGIQLSDDAVYSGANKPELLIRRVPTTWKGDMGFSVRVTNT
ncbi:MAG: immunoglobulin domain-containing protein, partial [Chthoniobacteraceae bacterium]|nr:immunoglobulin domain-containing protein [Chthoniobacteraceae bacterium]